MILLGNCLDKLKDIEDNSVDSIVTDPPYELGFMGKAWDNTGIAYNKDMWAECLRVLKPGGHILAFSGTRTYHRMAVAIEDAGFEIRDMVEYVYGSGFPKSLNIRKQYEKTKQKAESQLSELWQGIIHQALVSEENNDRGSLQRMLEDLEQGKQYQILTYPRGEVQDLPLSERQRQSCMERWAYLSSQEGELRTPCKVCQMPTGFYFNGTQGWLCYGTSFDNGTVTWEAIDENGSCTSYKSSTTGQPFGKLNVICEQCSAQILRESEGVGSALKPAHEPLCLARKPITEKNLIKNLTKLK